MKLRGLLPSKPIFLWALAALLGVAGLLLYRLGTMPAGLSSTEMHTLTTPIGWSGLYHNPFDLPLQFVRSVIFYVQPEHGHMLLRLPNTLFGALAIASFAWLVLIWHGRRTALMATVLFATAAWTLHVSRLASLDIMYFWATPTLLLVQLLLQRNKGRPLTWFAGLFTLGLLLYIPGFVWLILFGVILQRKVFIQNWQQFNRWWQRLAAVLSFGVWLPLLALHLSRAGEWKTWLGLPEHFASITTIIKDFVGVFVHLFIRGPQYPELWLGKAPLMDVFTLLACLCGIYFYIRRWNSKRSRLLAGLLLIGAILVALGGPVTFSVVVPLVYLAAATGIAFLLHDWLKTFPYNPLARGVGVGLVSAVIALSCLYNIRAYFVAWAHSPVTQATFRYDRP